jgi:hypothetical protein
VLMTIMGSVRDPDVIVKDVSAVPSGGTSKSDSLDLKTEPGHGMYDSPSDSSPEPEASAGIGPQNDKTSLDPAPPVKRKGGRKPVSCRWWSRSRKSLTDRVDLRNIRGT